MWRQSRGCREAIHHSRIAIQRACTRRAPLRLPGVVVLMGTLTLLAGLCAAFVIGYILGVTS